jgi:hypothetical protein
MTALADEAVEAMKALGKFDKTSEKMAKDAERQAENYKRAMAIISEKPK